MRRVELCGGGWVFRGRRCWGEGLIGSVLIDRGKIFQEGHGKMLSCMVMVEQFYFWTSMLQCSQSFLLVILRRVKRIMELADLGCVWFDTCRYRCILLYASNGNEKEKRETNESELSNYLAIKDIESMICSTMYFKEALAI